MTYKLPFDFSISDIENIVKKDSKFVIDKKARKKIIEVRKKLSKLIDQNRVMYGINTGFGELASKSISQENLKQLQLNLIRSHSTGVGNPLSDEEVRLLMFIRANELARGASGVRIEVIEKLCEFLNKGVIPYIPEKGSVGASGDLAPSSHMALCLIGEGYAKVMGDDRFEKTEKILKKFSISPITLEEKEGLALINGTQATSAIGSLALLKGLKVFHTSIVAGALSVDSLKGTTVCFDERISNLKPHPGQTYVAKKLTELLKGSEIRESHRINDNRVQDPYSLRCMPQVMGAVMDNLYHCVNIVENEYKSVTDNPLVFFDGKNIDVLSGGNFHAQALSFAFDIAAMVLTANGNMSERRIAQLVSDFKILPPFLAKNPGLESGLMICQVTAASLCNQNNILSHPASTFSLPTSANKEDFVSMGTNAALKLREVVENVSRIIAIELIGGVRAIEFHRPLKTSPTLEDVIRKIKDVCGNLDGDIEFSSKIEALSDSILNGDFLV